MTGLDRFKRDVRKTAKANGIKIKLLKKDSVSSRYDKLPCHGYFSDEDMELCVAIKGTELSWVHVLVHESCHMDQFVENKYLWTKCNPGFNLFSKWLLGKSIVKREVLEEAVQDIIRLELDCERRAVEKIKKYDLNIDIETYIQCSNLCLYGYLFFLEKKKWCNDILDIDSVTDLAPKRFRTNYDKIPVKFHKALLKEYNSLYKAA